MGGKKLKKVIFWSIVAGVAIVLFFFLRDVFSGHLILDPYAIDTSFLHVKWYGIIIGSSVIVSYLIARHQLLSEGVKEDDFIMVMVVAIFFAVLGGRLFYVSFTWNEYFKYHVSQILEPWTGGMAIFGALMGIFFAGWLYTRLKKNCSFTYLEALDAFAMVAPFAQAMGRWGNFFNYEAYGGPTDLPWKMFVPLQYRMPQFVSDKFFTPTFLYESIVDLFVFYLIYTFTKNKRTTYGQTFALYLILYSSGRFFNEAMRLDSLWFYSIRVDQVMPVIFIVTGSLIFAYIKRHGRPVERIKMGEEPS